MESIVPVETRMCDMEGGCGTGNEEDTMYISEKTPLYRATNNVVPRYVTPSTVVSFSSVFRDMFSSLIHKRYKAVINHDFGGGQELHQFHTVSIQNQNTHTPNCTLEV
jgi:hypothetical protein